MQVVVRIQFNIIYYSLLSLSLHTDRYICIKNLTILCINDILSVEVFIQSMRRV